MLLVRQSAVAFTRNHSPVLALLNLQPAEQWGGVAEQKERELKELNLKSVPT